MLRTVVNNTKPSKFVKNDTDMQRKKKTTKTNTAF